MQVVSRYRSNCVYSIKRYASKDIKLVDISVNLIVFFAYQSLISSCLSDLLSYQIPCQQYCAAVVRKYERQDLIMDVVKLTDRIMVVDMGIDKTLVVVKIIDKTGSEWILRRRIHKLIRKVRMFTYLTLERQMTLQYYPVYYSDLFSLRS
jgi:hypothetical protein